MVRSESYSHRMKTSKGEIKLYGKKTLWQRCITLWNSHFREILETHSLETFITRIDKTLENGLWSKVVQCTAIWNRIMELFNLEIQWFWDSELNHICGIYFRLPCVINTYLKIDLYRHWISNLLFWFSLDS